MMRFVAGLTVDRGIEKEGRKEVIPAEQFFYPLVAAADTVEQGENILDRVSLKARQIEPLIDRF